MNIDKIEFVPSINNLKAGKSSIEDRLRESLEKCVNIKGVVAYWTIGKDCMPILAEKLEHEDSFYCVDLNITTDIDKLNEFARQKATNQEYKANLFLFTKKLRKRSTAVQSTSDIKREKYTHLLHSKVICFENTDNTVEIWIGSHNMTHRAIKGGNIESTSVIHTSKGSDFHKEILEFLNFIKEQCIDFDPDEIAYYKQVQSNQLSEEYERVWILEMLGEDIHTLKKGDEIIILGCQIENVYDNLRKHYGRDNQDTFVYAYNICNKKYYLYKIEILGNEKAEELDIAKDLERRYALQVDRLVPFITKDKKKIETTFSNCFKWYSRIKIIEIVQEYKIPGDTTITKSFCWKTIPIEELPHLSKMSADNKEMIFGKSKKPITHSDKVVQDSHLNILEIIYSVSEIVDFYKNLGDNPCQSSSQGIRMIWNLTRKSLIYLPKKYNNSEN
ncbi:hypothetical protein FJR11_09860 [Anabaena sp. UHCC 0187]|uniref:hypothetical protein n=1 Tax=Anabaena sp. UHCC 0187 TaxID=2590018 RepID=UPI0014467D3A|nr:hypothetical protein [Anabaena sp. UHCC 0187]MTJ12890.1 hypothetical protein [Anabaena sp. UHCC 0187]